MEFYNIYENLCRERGLKPQCAEMQAAAGVSGSAIGYWKTGSCPRADAVVRLALFFGVSADFLLGLSQSRSGGEILTAEEAEILSIFRAADVPARFRIIQACMTEKTDAELKRANA